MSEVEAGSEWQGTWHKFYANMSHTGASREQSTRKKQTVRITNHVIFWFCTETSSFAPISKTNLPGLQNSTNFCVDIRNQERPILLGIG